MKVHLFMAVALVGLSQPCHSCTAPLDRNEARNANACKARSMRAAKNELDSFVANLHRRLAAFVDGNYANRMDTLQRQWLSLADMHCEHSRGIYGKGSAGSLNAITCRELLYKDRLQELKNIYHDALVER
jgi:uncharacterized protein YecT (DUF1311 family)